VTVDATLAAIDGALADWDTSGDAMRWNPDPALDRVICDGGRPLWPERWSLWRHGTWSYRVTPIVLDPAAMPRADFLREFVASFALLGQAYIRAAEPAIQSFSEAVGRAALAASHGVALDVAKAFGVRPSLLGIGGHDHSPARCRRCNPAGNPLPLTVDGGAYRRRQRARRRR
jgi:hypothetical protein